MDKYSALAASGGDGSIFEVINGMLHRPDGRKLPLWLIPNGSGNCYTRNFGNNTVDDALLQIKKGHVIKADVIKVLVDYESEEAIMEAGADATKHIMYSMVSVDLGLVGQLIRHSTRTLKTIFGGIVYVFMAFYKVLIPGVTWNFKVIMEDGKQTIDRINT